MITLRAIRSAVPSRKVSAAEIAKWVDADEAFIAEKVGARERYFLESGERGVDLAAKAARAAMEAANIGTGEIEALVFVTQTPDYRIPHSAALLQHELKLPESCAAFDISLGCSGYVYGTSILQSFMQANAMRLGMLVTCDPYSRIMNRHDKSTTAVFGDGATASILWEGEGARWGKFDFGTSGDQSDALILRAPGGALPSQGVWDESPRAHSVEDLTLEMNGRKVFNFVVKNIPKSVARCLDRNSLSLQEIDCFAFHQGSLYMLQTLAKQLDIPNDKLLVNIDRVANTVSSSLPMLLEEAMAANPRVAGRRILASGFGVGLSWGTGVLTLP